MIGRLVQAADFQRLLAAPTRQRSAHFTVHHVAGVPSRPAKAPPRLVDSELSTTDVQGCPEPVDESPAARWLGCVVPKRHARRSVTRNVLKRQIRAAVERHEERLEAGLWLVRLRSPFAPTEFPSADSEALRAAARSELDRLLAPAAR